VTVEYKMLCNSIKNIYEVTNNQIDKQVNLKNLKTKN